MIQGKLAASTELSYEERKGMCKAADIGSSQVIHCTVGLTMQCIIGEDQM
jgi:hypothetical protein